MITPAAGLEGFCAGLHAEHPSLGLTLIRTADSMTGLLAAQRFAATEPGQFRQVVVDAGGEPWQPVMAPAGRPGPVPPGRAGPAAAPAGRDDVVLIIGGQPAGLLAAAAVLGTSGARLALIGPPDPDDPAGLDLALAGLRGSGIEVSYLQADLTDPDEAGAAVASVEQRIGPVTAVCCTADPGLAIPCAGLSGPDLRTRMAWQADGLRSVLGSVHAGRLRLLVTCGSAAARYGAAGQCGPALLAGALAEQARQLAPGLSGCRIVHADWDPAAEAAEVGRLLLAAGPAGPAPARVAIHGRLGPAAPPPAAVGTGRFLEQVLVHHPGVELVTEAVISAATDPYLGGYVLDGLAALPPAMSLEALAQAASALAGRPLRRLEEVTMDVPVLLPAGGVDARVRVCALHRGDAVEAVLRFSGSGFHLNHVRAVFPLRGTDGPDLRPQPAPRAVLTVAAPGGIVDGTDLYGLLCFQAGPFRRVAFLPEVTARSCRALIRGADDRPWFSRRRDGTAPLVLGSPGLNDAVMHVLQACVPHRRVLPAGLRSLTAAGAEARGAVSARAQRQADGSWDVAAQDGTGNPVLRVTGLRLRDIGPLEQPAAWHPTLLATALEAHGAQLGLDPSLRVTVRCGVSATARLDHPDQAPAPAGLPWLDQAVGTGRLAGYELTVRAGQPVACYWEAAGPGPSPGPADLAARLQDRAGGDPATVSARMRAITACLTAAGWTDGTPLQLDDAHDGEWIRVQGGAITVAAVATRIDGVPQPVAIALATWPSAAGHPADPGVLARGAPGR